MLLALAAFGGVVACGGGGATDEDEAGRAIERAFAAQDASMYCEQLTTRRFIERIYESADKCRAYLGDVDGSVDDIEVSRVRVDGRAGTAHVRWADGFGHAVGIRKEGDRWRLDAYGEDMLRFTVKTFLLGFTKVKSFDEALVKSCATRVSTELPERRVAQFAYPVFADRLNPDVAKQFGGLLGMCMAMAQQPNGEAIMGRAFEEAMQNDNPPLSDEELRCVIRRVDPSIAADLTSPGTEFRLTAKARRAFAIAADACGYDPAAARKAVAE